MSEQTRRGDGRFRATYSDERRYELLRLVALKVSPLDPASVSQPQFDLCAGEVAAEQGWPSPPKANAIYMQLTWRRKRSWRQLVESALAAAAEGHSSFGRSALPRASSRLGGSTSGTSCMGSVGCSISARSRKPRSLPRNGGRS